jgi:hypothetical protein
LWTQELEVPSLANDSCETSGRLTLDPLESSGKAVSGNSTPSRPHGLQNADCSLIATSRGLFYSFEGTGDTLNVTLTISTDEIRLELAILTIGCGTCITVSDFSTLDDSPHSITFESEPDELYVVVVSGQGFADVGVFAIEVGVATEDSQIGESGAFHQPVSFWLLHGLVALVSLGICL